jgi:hypothetical protein
MVIVHESPALARVLAVLETQLRALPPRVFAFMSINSAQQLVARFTFAVHVIAPDLVALIVVS